MENKIFYFLALIVLIVFAFNYYVISDHDEKYPDVLPEAGYCLDLGKPISYTTYFDGDKYKPIEYCKLNNFCQQYEVSTVNIDSKYDQDKLDNFEKQWPEHSCFQEESLNSNDNETKLKSKFVCCNPSEEPEGCEENVCNGTFTGAKDTYGCKIYAIEKCFISTNCRKIPGGVNCDPSPIKNNFCKWETKSSSGLTYFTQLDQCGLELKKICGKKANYDCDGGKVCTAFYDYHVNDFIKGCGGYVGS